MLHKSWRKVIPIQLPKQREDQTKGQEDGNEDVDEDEDKQEFICLFQEFGYSVDENESGT